jgi:flagellar M-ring protein FliF
MEPLKRALASIGAALSRLDATQKLLIGAVVVILAMVLFLVQVWTGTADLVPLLPGQPAERQARALQFVQDNDVQFEQKAGEVMVPRGQRQILLARMADASALPDDSRILFDNLIDKQSWTLSQRQNYQLEVVAVQNELASIISKMNGIQSARVIMNIPEKRTMGQPASQPSAIATIFPTKPVDQSTIDAIAHLVAGARGIDVQHVRVIDGATNRQFRAGDEQGMTAATYLEYVGVVEQRKQRQLYDMLSSYIPGVIVSVHAQVDVTRRRTERKTVLPEGKGSATMLVQEQNDSREDREASSGGEPGARSNTREDIALGGGGGQSSTEAKADSKFEAEFGREVSVVEDPRGQPTKINAVVNIPRPYFVQVWRASQPAAGAAGAAGAGAAPADGGAAGAADPTEEQIKAVVDAEVARIKGEVELQIDTSAGADTIKGEVQVSMIPAPMDLPTAPASASMLGVPVGGAEMGGLVKTIALGGLAVVALGMVVMTAMRASKREALPTAEELVGLPPQLANNADLVGEAMEADSVLQGLELSDDEMKTRKMMEQVTDLVTEKPDEAARLLGRWIAGT